MNHGDKYKNISSRGCVCCLATSNDENVIISAKFDKRLLFDHITSRDYSFYFGLYVILLFIEIFSFEPKTLCMIHLLWAKPIW